MMKYRIFVKKSINFSTKPITISIVFKLIENVFTYRQIFIKGIETGCGVFLTILSTYSGCPLSRYIVQYH